MRIPLQKLRYLKPQVVANLPGLKCIIRTETARLVKWYHVLPASGDGDSSCLLLLTMPKKNEKPCDQARLIAVEVARYA